MHSFSRRSKTLSTFHFSRAQLIYLWLLPIEMQDLKDLFMCISIKSLSHLNLFCFRVYYCVDVIMLTQSHINHEHKE